MSLLSCGSSDKNRVAKEVKALTGRHIVFPEGYMPLPVRDSLYADSLLGMDVKIVSYIDNLPCTSCGVKMLRSWIRRTELICPDAAFLIVVQTTERDTLLQYADSMHLSVPLLYYDSDVFGRVNGLDALARNKTFLLDRYDNIILVGEPFYNEKLSTLYKKRVKSLLDEYAK